MVQIAPMIAFCVRAAVKCLLLAAFLYVVCFVKLGRATTLEHLRRIAGTSEAREFGSEVAGAAQRVKTSALQTISGPGATASPSSTGLNH